MILLFFLSTAAGYLAVSTACAWRAVSRQTITGTLARSVASLLVLVATCLILVLPLLDRLPILTWNEISRYLAGPRVAVVALGVFAGCVLHYWHTQIVGNLPWHGNSKVHWLWAGALGTLFAMGIGLPYLSMVAGITGIRSLQTAGVHLEFGVVASRSLERLNFEVERHEAARWRVEHFVNAAVENGGLPTLLFQDIALYRNVLKYERVLGMVPETDARRILLDFSRARQFSNGYLSPIFECARVALQEHRLDQTQTVQHFLRFGHGLRRVLRAGRSFVPIQTGPAPTKMDEALNALRDGVRHAAANFCPIAGPNHADPLDEAWLRRPVEEIAALSTVPHLYVLLAWLYMSADELETALEVLEEGDARDELVVFRNDMNYNQTRGYLLYLLERPVEESIVYQDRVLDFANRVVDAIPQKWPDGNSTREFVLRYAVAQRVSRQELAFLLAQQSGTPRIHEALDYARTFFEETGHWERTWRWGMQWGRYFGNFQRIKIGGFDDWSRDEIYWLPPDNVLSYLVYGYVLMASGAHTLVPHTEALAIARDLFEEGLQEYKTDEQELRQYGQHATYVRLQSYLAQANRLLKEASYVH